MMAKDRVHPVSDLGMSDAKAYEDGTNGPGSYSDEAKGVEEQAMISVEHDSSLSGSPVKAGEDKEPPPVSAKHTAIAAMYEQPKYLLDPRQQFMQRWDMLVASLLLFTSIVTPFEVAYLETELNALFFLNRFVDLCFTIDMLFNFNLAYHDASLGSGLWVMERKKIIARYLKGSFAVDLVSILPFDSIGLVMQSSDISKLKILRVVRLLRLFKLLRILRSGRILKRLESNINVDYNMLTLFKFVIGTLFIAHWLACAWHMLTKVQEKTNDWVTYYFSSYESGDPNYPGEYADWEAVLCPDKTDPENCTTHHEWMGMSVGDLYVASFYWALVTMSTIGYGDIIPTNTVERFFIIFAMLIGTSVFAYVVGSVCGLVSAMDKKNNEFYELMDNLNNFMQETKLEMELRIRLRAYFRYKRRNTSMEEWHTLLNMMSPGLRGESAIQQCGEWIKNVVFFQGAPRDFVVDIALSLRSETYPQGEEIIKLNEVATKMYIVERGVVGGKGRVYTSGRVFGEDILAGEHESEYMMRALTFTDVFALKRESLEEVVVKYPRVKRNLREAACRQMAKDAVLAFVKHWTKIQEGTPADLLAYRRAAAAADHDADELDMDIVSPGRRALKEKQLNIQRFAMAMAGLHDGGEDSSRGSGAPPLKTPAFKDLLSAKDRRALGSNASMTAPFQHNPLSPGSAVVAEAEEMFAHHGGGGGGGNGGSSSRPASPVIGMVSKLAVQLDAMAHSLNTISRRIETIESRVGSGGV